MKEELDYSPGAKPLYAQLHDILLGKLKPENTKRTMCCPLRLSLKRSLASAVSLPVVRSPSWPPKGW